MGLGRSTRNRTSSRRRQPGLHGLGYNKRLKRTSWEYERHRSWCRWCQWCQRRRVPRRLLRLLRESASVKCHRVPAAQGPMSRFRFAIQIEILSIGRVTSLRVFIFSRHLPRPRPLCSSGGAPAGGRGGPEWSANVGSGSARGLRDGMQAGKASSRLRSSAEQRRSITSAASTPLSLPPGPCPRGRWVRLGPA